jgi:hypothetical protein
MFELTAVPLFMGLKRNGSDADRGHKRPPFHEGCMMRVNEPSQRAGKCRHYSEVNGENKKLGSIHSRIKRQFGCGVILGQVFIS